MSPDFIAPFERALTAQGVPFRLVGGKEYYARDEVKALASVLRAVDNPADRLSLFAALRSPFFGFSDDDLWQLVAKAGHLNYQAPVPGEARGAAALTKAFDLLKPLHRPRRMFPPSDLIVRLFERTRALAAYRLRPEGDHKVANLWKTLDVARAYEAAGPTTLRTLVRHLEEETTLFNETYTMSQLQPRTAPTKTRLSKLIVALLCALLGSTAMSAERQRSAEPVTFANKSMSLTIAPDGKVRM